MTASVLCVGCGAAQGVAAHERVDDLAPPVRGGTLKIVALSDVDHLATTSAGYVMALQLLRTFARQLITYPAVADYEATTRLVSDLAEIVPTQENGGISADGRTYVFHLQRGVLWNTTPPRPVTAGDFVRAFKLLCNPVAPAGSRYHITTIVGMAEQCSAFATVPGTIAAIRQFVTTHEIDGVRALDDLTLEFKLLAPAVDFLNILALPFASAVPEEYLGYLPDSPEFRQHTISNGPYTITQYLHDRGYVLERNPVWNAQRDPNRPAHVDRIYVQIGDDPAMAQLQIEAGTADLGDVMPTSDAAVGLANRDRRVRLLPQGDHYDGMAYLVINLVGPNNGAALARLEVRQALAVAVNKQALVQLTGGPGLSRALYQAAPAAVAGFRDDANQFVTARDRGDPELARHLLTQSGLPNGLVLRLVYDTYGPDPLYAQSVQASLRRAGIDAQLYPYTPGDFFGHVLPDRQKAERGAWDLALNVWVMDWFGANNGRTIVANLFDGRSWGQSPDYGGYNNPIVNAAIDRALVAPNSQSAEAAWAEAAHQAMTDVAIVPLIEKKYAFMTSSRLRGCVWAVLGMGCSLPDVWLTDGASAGPDRRP